MRNKKKKKQKWNKSEGKGGYRGIIKDEEGVALYP